MCESLDCRLNVYKKELYFILVEELDGKQRLEWHRSANTKNRHQGVSFNLGVSDKD